jgi:hypothetical protein
MGYLINSGDSLAAYLKAVWYIAAGTSGTDSTGNGYTLSFDSSVSSGTDGMSDPCLSEATTMKPVATVASGGFTLSGSWSIAWRAKQTSSGTSGMIIGDHTDASGHSFVWFNGGSNLRFRNSSGTDYNFGAVTVFTSDHDWLLVYDQPNALLHLYQDGTEIGSGTSVSDGTLKVTSVGTAYGLTGSVDEYSLVGTMTYCYVWQGRALTNADAQALAVNYSTPGNSYRFLRAPGGGGQIVGSNIVSQQPFEIASPIIRGPQCLLLTNRVTRYGLNSLPPASIREQQRTQTRHQLLPEHLIGTGRTMAA